LSDNRRITHSNILSTQRRR